MKLIKRIYFILFVASLMFLFSQCGEKNNSGDKQHPESVNTKSKDISAIVGNSENGKLLFDRTCAACHGVDAKGLPNLGKDLTTSNFVKSESNKDLLEFIKKGRPVNDPLNTTHVAMPPKGGNAALTDQQLIDIIAYMRQLHK